MSSNDAAPADPLKGIAIYRLVRAMCASVLLIPIFGITAAFARPLSFQLEEFLAGASYLSILVTPLIVVAGVVIGIVAGIRDQLSDEVDRKMWRLLGAVAGVFALLYVLGRNW